MTPTTPTTPAHAGAGRLGVLVAAAVACVFVLLLALSLVSRVASPDRGIGGVWLRADKEMLLTLRPDGTGEQLFRGGGRYDGPVRWKLDSGIVLMYGGRWTPLDGNTQNPARVPWSVSNDGTTLSLGEDTYTRTTLTKP